MKKNKHLKIEIEAIPHKFHRYPTCGDYWTDCDTEKIRVSQMSDWRMELLIAIHEMIEDFLCQHRGIKESDITKFDKKYEKEREQGLHKPDDEPGHDLRSPYRKEHQFAEKIELLLAKELNVNWNHYAKEIESL